MARNICKIDGCDNYVMGHGHCSKHWQRLYKRGTLELTRDWGQGKTHEERFWSRVEKSDGCWIWEGTKNKNGYGSVTVNYKRLYAHRFAWFLTHGKMPEQFLLHSCDTPLCVNPAHLSEGTAADNAADMARKGRSGNRGERSKMAKLTDEKVREIRTRMSNGETICAISRELKMSTGTICGIKHYKRWKHVV